MDPNVTLMKIRDNLDKAEAKEKLGLDASSYYEYAAAYFEDLDIWLERGGFLPDSWNKNRGA